MPDPVTTAGSLVRKIRLERIRETRPIKSRKAAEWLATVDSANAVMVQAGFPPVKGYPLGQLFEIPEIIGEAERLAGEVRSRETARQKRDVPVDYDVILQDGALVARASFAQPARDQSNPYARN